MSIHLDFNSPLYDVQCLACKVQIKPLNTIPAALQLIINLLTAEHSGAHADVCISHELCLRSNTLVLVQDQVEEERINGGLAHWEDEDGHSFYMSHADR